MPQNWLDLGNWNAICDVCGLKFKGSDLKKDWRGLMVCSKDFEQRHPQDFLRVRADDPSIPWARPQGEDQFVYVCYLWGRSAYADLGEADCMRSDYTPFSYDILFQMKYGFDPGHPIFPTAIPGIAFPGLAIPATEFF